VIVDLAFPFKGLDGNQRDPFDIVDHWGDVCSRFSEAACVEVLNCTASARAVTNGADVCYGVGKGKFIYGSAL